jgi:hypothetical protein
MNRGDVSVVEEVISADFIDRSYGLRGMADVQRSSTATARRGPICTSRSEDMVAEEDRVAVRWGARGTHHTSTAATWTGMGFRRLADDQIGRALGQQ